MCRTFATETLSNIVREIEEDLDKSEAQTMFRNLNTNIVKMPISPNWCADLIHFLSTSHTFVDIDKTVLKFTRKVKGTRIAKIIFKSKVRFTLLFYQSLTQRSMEQNGESEINWQKYVQLILPKVQKQFKEEL